MKKTSLFSILTLATMLVALPVFSGEGIKGAIGEYGRDGQNEKYEQHGIKDECLLLAKNCANETDTIQQRIERLHNEILKGSDVYTPDELNSLNRQLSDEYKNYYDLTQGGYGHRSRMKHVR
jgi:hypothetical protein